ncbi:MAG: protein kinase [Candidatus Paceibacterota bacterium]
MIEKLDLDQIKSLLPNVQELTFFRKGGFKFVYKGKIKNNIEAIKFVYIPVDQNDKEVKEENLRRAKREVEIIKKTKSPFLVKLGKLTPIEQIIDDKTFYLYSEEFLNGDNLSELIKKGYNPTQKELKILCSCLLDCITEFKGSRVVHRDIKPLNIIKTKDRSRPFVLFDLGVAFYTAGTNLTKDPRRVPGTVPYYAPEYFDNKFRDRLDFRTDLYNIGLTIYEYSTRTHPFKSNDQYTTLSSIIHKTPEPIKSQRVDLEDSFCQLIDSWLKKKPMLRESNFDKIKEIIQ